MKKYWIILSILVASIGQARELTSFEEVKSAVESGRQVSMVMHFNACQSDKPWEDTHPTVKAAFMPSSFMITPNRLATSDMHFTKSHPGYLEHAVFEYVKYSILNDNTVVIRRETLSAQNYAPIGQPSTFVCKIGPSIKLFSYDNR